MEKFERVVALRRMLIAHEASRNPGAEAASQIEATIGDDEPLPSDHAILHRVDATISATAECREIDSIDLNKSRDTLYFFAETALSKLAGGAPDLSADELGALELIVIADGTRPSFLLSGGKPDLDDPMMGSWADTVSAHYPIMRKLAGAVGRIQPANGSASKYIGTGTLIDADKMLILTNYHVIDDARVKHNVAMRQTGQIIEIDGTLEIDFDGEASSLKTNRFRLTRVELPVGHGRGFGVIDAAVAQIEPVDGTSILPATVPLLLKDPSYANGGMISLATVGFPGPPPSTVGVTGTVDWAYVTKALFKNKFGFKRLAPGTFTSPRGSDFGDANHTAIGHNATTFGGASGSLVTVWADEGAPSFALHFTGATGRENHALAFAPVADALLAAGVPLV